MVDDENRNSFDQPTNITWKHAAVPKTRSAECGVRSAECGVRQKKKKNYK